MISLQYKDDQSNEFFPLITESGEVVGRATRRYCHSGSMALHPVIHLHIFDREGRLYLQKRSMRKDIAPGKWDTSVGGHVDYGEDLLSAVVREAREEVGIKVAESELQFLFQYIWQSSRERELVTAFAITYDGVISPDHDEVDEGRFFTWQELQVMMEQGMLTEQFMRSEYQQLVERLGVSSSETEASDESAK